MAMVFQMCRAAYNPVLAQRTAYIFRVSRARVLLFSFGFQFTDEVKMEKGDEHYASGVDCG